MASSGIMLLIGRPKPSSRFSFDTVDFQILIMKVMSHPNIVNLIEVIDDPTADHLYMVLEYVEGKWVCEDAVTPGGLGEETARKYLRDVVSGLMYLHAHNVVHGDIKPDNLLVTGSGTVKIGDFSVIQVFEGNNDELRRSPGTPVFTAPECCLDDMNPLLKNLLEGLLCKDPGKRMTLQNIAHHPWVIKDATPIPLYLCWCERRRLQKGASGGIGNDTLVYQP